MKAALAGDRSESVTPAGRLSVQIAQISRDGLDLRVTQIMRDRLHDGGVVRLGLILAPLLVPVRQLSIDVVVELARQTGKRVGASGIRSVTRCAWRYLGAGNALLIDFFPVGHELLRRASQRLWIEVLEIGG